MRDAPGLLARVSLAVAFLRVLHQHPRCLTVPGFFNYRCRCSDSSRLSAIRRMPRTYLHPEIAREKRNFWNEIFLTSELNRQLAERHKFKCYFKCRFKLHKCQIFLGYDRRLQFFWNLDYDLKFYISIENRNWKTCISQNILRCSCI